MNIAICTIEKKDKVALAAVYSKIVFYEFPEYSASIREQFSSGAYKDLMLKKDIKLGVFDGEMLVGFLLAENPFGGVMFISWLGMLPEYQHKGIGVNLLKHIEKIAIEKGAHNIQLYADERNLPFYKHLGYEVLGFEEKGYFGTDNYIMRKVIQDPQPETFFKFS